MKKMCKLAALCLAMFMLNASSANAQGVQREDEVDDVVYLIMQVPEGSFQDPKMTNNFYRSKNKKMAIAAGGLLRVVNSADMFGVIKNNMNGGFIVPNIPSSSQGMSKGQFIISPATSQIYVKGVGMLDNGRSIQGYLSMNFMGNGYAPSLYQAYVKLYNFTVGKAWNLMADINSAPPTIDYWGPSGFGGFRNAIIRYENSISPRFEYGVSVEMPMVDATYNNMTHGITQSVPDAAGYIQYRWGENGESKLRFSALYRYMSYFDEIGNKSTADNGYGIQLSGQANITENLIAYYRGIAGYGISSYINDLSTMPLDMVPNQEKEGKLTNLGAYGAYAGLQYNISDDLFVSATYSQARMYSRKTAIEPSSHYRYSQYIVANCFWNLSKNAQVAVEYLRGIKSDFNGEHHSANRINLLVQYNF